MIWIGVVSHWLLDLIVHRPDLPLYAHSRVFGLGLWNHRVATIVIELAMFGLFRVLNHQISANDPGRSPLAAQVFFHSVN